MSRKYDFHHNGSSVILTDESENSATIFFYL